MLEQGLCSLAVVLRGAKLMFVQQINEFKSVSFYWENWD